MELQQFFIKIRDELCKNGEILLSTSLNYTSKHLHSDVEQEKREKVPKEMEEDKLKEEEEENKGVCLWTSGTIHRVEEYGQMLMWYSFEIILYFLSKEGEKAKDLPGEKWQSESETGRVYIQSCSFENSTYHVGDFVYVEPSEPKLKSHIVCIELMWEDEAGNISY